MTDKDETLLELAAKAAGLSHPDGVYWVRNDTGDSWNPLIDDGDALRLAVQLKLDVFFHPSSVEAHIAGGRIPPIRHIARELYDADPYAATRRAITRAAAEIGRSMK
jgi:hypothetical protein